jgi:hypothetical protein
LVNFWTLTCINWLRQEPYVRAWWQAYRDDGLIVIGVHTPEFSFEHEIDRIRPAIKTRAIDYPVAVDNHYAIWSAFANHYWPALYFIDKDGIIRDHGVRIHLRVRRSPPDKGRLAGITRTRQPTGIRPVTGGMTRPSRRGRWAISGCSIVVLVDGCRVYLSRRAVSQ